MADFTDKIKEAAHDVTQGNFKEAINDFKNEDKNEKQNNQQTGSSQAENNQQDVQQNEQDDMMFDDIYMASSEGDVTDQAQEGQSESTSTSEPSTTLQDDQGITDDASEDEYIDDSDDVDAIYFEEIDVYIEQPITDEDLQEATDQDRC